MAAGVTSIPDTWEYTSHYELGTVQRQITTTGAPGWPVAFEKTDGPGMYMGAANCTTGAIFDVHTLADPDHPIAWEEVANIAQWTYFCTTWKSRGSNPSDTFRGTLAWD